MKNTFYRFTCLILIFGLFLSFVACSKSSSTDAENDKINIVVTTFPCYDFVRATTKDIPNIQIKMLIKPGAEIHSFDPTPQDLIAIQKSDLFIYNGGESDHWVDEILISMEKNAPKTLRLIESVALLEEEHLYFYDASSPIIETSSIDFSIAFKQSRYDKGDADYINCPFTKEQFFEFYNELINAQRVPLHEFEKELHFDACQPIESIAKGGFKSLTFGPMKPVGLIDKRTNEKNYAVVQLRQDNSAKTLFNLVGFQTNLKWGAQKELLQAIPGLENVNIVRYGVMHRNTFINSPTLLNPTLQTRERKDLFFAGQITGTEGYTESIASGLLAGINMAKLLNDEPLLELPLDTMLGALTHYITNPEHDNFQPINSNWGIVPPVELPKKERKNKKLKGELMSNRALESLKSYIGNL
mgnify:CR=1 FL=1